MTSLSGPRSAHLTHGAGSGRISAKTLMARASLFVGIAMLPSACLVISPPQVEDPERTPPFLLEETANPDARETWKIDLDSASLSFVEFSVNVRSEDDGLPVQGRLLLDYGVQASDGRPFEAEVSEDSDVPASTLQDTLRTLTARWYVKSYNYDGCHTVTLMASHEFTDDQCPVDPADSDAVTWLVYLCRDSGSVPCCDPVSDPDCPLPGYECPKLTGAQCEGVPPGGGL